MTDLCRLDSSLARPGKASRRMCASKQQSGMLLTGNRSCIPDDPVVHRSSNLCHARPQIWVIHQHLLPGVVTHVSVVVDRTANGQIKSVVSAYMTVNVRMCRSYGHDVNAHLVARRCIDSQFADGRDIDGGRQRRVDLDVPLMVSNRGRYGRGLSRLSRKGAGAVEPRHRRRAVSRSTLCPR
jgi:hypothetical protein